MTEDQINILAVDLWEEKAKRAVVITDTPKEDMLELYNYMYSFSPNIKANLMHSDITFNDRRVVFAKISDKRDCYRFGGMQINALYIKSILVGDSFSYMLSRIRGSSKERKYVEFI